MLWKSKLNRYWNYIYSEQLFHIDEHFNEAKRQITFLELIFDRNAISRSVLKGAMRKKHRWDSPSAICLLFM